MLEKQPRTFIGKELNATATLNTFIQNLICRDIITVYKILSGIIHCNVVSAYLISQVRIREHKCKLNKKHVHYNQTKYSFSNRPI